MALTVTNAPSAASSIATDIREIKPPIFIPSGWEWVWWAVGALVLAAILFAVWFWWRRKQRLAAAPLPIPPAHVRARQKLREALRIITQPKPFVIAVSDAARSYLEERFNFHAPERTTEEFLRELTASELLAKQQKESLGRFLESCDLVKFAKYEPGEAELRELYGAALRLVDETAPREDQSPKSKVQSHESE